MYFIYKYENMVNHKIYIGQTVDFGKRKREHFNASSNPNNKDYNLPIHAAIRKYGINNFTIVIIDTCNTHDQANEKEKYWIKTFDSYHSGYNATTGGQDGGYNGKQVDVYDLDGKYLKSYLNAKEAAKEMEVSYSTIQQVLHQKRPTCKNCQLKYHDDNRVIKKFYSRKGGKLPIYQLNKDTEQIIKEWESAAEAARQLHLDASGITKCLKGKLKTHGCFKWKYVL